MKIVKGFVVMENYIDNMPGTTSKLGELSTWSSTFAKDKGVYTSASKNGYSLVTFKNINTDNGSKDPLNQELVDEIFNIVNSMIQYSLQRIRPLNIADFRQDINNTYALDISNLAFGLLRDNGSIELPEWFSYKSMRNNSADIKIWLSNDAFKSQYDDYELVIIPPLLPLDNLFGFYDTVKDTLSIRSDSAMIDAIQAEKGETPDTVTRLVTFDLVNQLNPAQKFSTNWAVLVYGQAGDNIDVIKDSIIDYVLKNSSKSRADWERFIPDLFKRTEFIMYPRWDKVSILNLTGSSELYSSILKPLECIQFFKTNNNLFNSDYIDTNLRILPYDYKGISLLSVPGTSNVETKKELEKLFSDYVPISSLSLDFGRMNVKTKEWIVLIEKLIQAAETVNEYSSVPLGVRRIARNGVLYISGVHDNVNYLVACKSNTFYKTT